MYAHVTTYRLGTSDEALYEIRWANQVGEVVSDQTARTIASWWHSPAATCRNITALSHGLPFDTEELRAEVEREVTDMDDVNALMGWIDHLEVLLADNV